MERGNFKMARMRKRSFEREYVQIPNETAQAPQIKINKKDNEKPIPLESSGLLLNLCSYSDNFELHKTELYKRFAYNKETSVKKAWKFLMDAGYIIEFKYRDGKRWEYVYYFDVIPYTEEQKQILWQEATEEYGEIWGLDFPDLKMRTSNCGPQIQEISNTELTKDSINEKQIKEKKIIDDDEADQFSVNDYAFREFISRWEKLYPGIFDNDTYNAIYQKMHEFKLSRFTYSEAKKQYLYMQKRIEEGKLELGDYAAYFVCGIKKKRKSEKSEIEKEKINQASNKSTANKNKTKNNEEAANKKPLPFYNWLES
jgi:hypothetical protein